MFLSPSAFVAPLPSDRHPGIARGRGGQVLICVCFSPRFSRFLRFLYRCHGEAYADGTSINNGLPVHDPGHRRSC
jgi:hypothetical protein